MPSLKLTAEIVERTKPGPTLIELVDLDPRARGLALRITPSRIKSWTLRYRLPTGERKRITLGNYPAMSLSKARDAVALKLAAIVDGRDPAAEKKAARATAERQRLETLSAVAERYFDAAGKGRHRHGKAKPKKPRTLKLERYYWDRFVSPSFGKRAIRSIGRGDIQTFVNEHSAPSTGRQIRVVFQRLFAFARWLELIDADPSHFVQVDAQQARDRVLTDNELRALWTVLRDPEALDSLKVTKGRAVAIALCAVTLQRRAEVAGIDLSELDLTAKTWTIPANRAKNGRVHAVPLSNEALALIDEARSIRVFDRGAAQGDPLFPTARGVPKAIDAANLTRAFIAVARRAGISNARLHDLRRTGATAMTSERIGVQRFIVSRVLNHASDQGDAAAVTAVYDRNAYLAEKRRALEAWGVLLEEIVERKPRSSNVVTIRQSSAAQTE
jgi:integrase